MSRQRGQKPSSGLIAGALTVVLALAVSLAGLEAIVRVLDGVGFGARNYVADRLSLLASAYPSVYHPQLGYVPEPDYDGTANAWRSDEHKSELQSLMRISYAVFCLKKKKQYI